MKNGNWNYRLTVEEHLLFYADLKTGTTLKSRQEVDQMIDDLGLSHKRNDLALHLSGGMKRKLSIGAAFIGNSKSVQGKQLFIDQLIILPLFLAGRLFWTNRLLGSIPILADPFGKYFSSTKQVIISQIFFHFVCKNEN